MCIIEQSSLQAASDRISVYPERASAINERQVLAIEGIGKCERPSEAADVYPERASEAATVYPEPSSEAARYTRSSVYPERVNIERAKVYIPSERNGKCIMSDRVCISRASE